MRYWSTSALVLLMLLGACSRESFVMTGKLTYARAQGVYELDLETGHEVALLQSPGTLYEALSTLDQDRLLLGSRGASGTKIRILQRSTGKLEDFTVGYRPMVMPDRRHVFFFKSSVATGPRLYVADVGGSGQELRSVPVGEEEFGSYSHVVPVSDNEVVFNRTGDGGESPPYIYDLVTGSLSQLPFTRKCTAYVWRTAGQQLICGVDGTDDYYLIKLDGTGYAPLPLLKSLPVLYVPQYDALLMSVSRLQWLGSNAGEQDDLWVLDFKTSERALLLKGGAPGRGATVWAP
jgi:hypothetical protein